MNGEYHTARYQRARMFNALGVGIVSLVALAGYSYLAAKSGKTDGFGYILAFGVIIGFYGFFDHRKYMKELMKKESTESGGEVVEC